jgi:hypothetical protein
LGVVTPSGVCVPVDISEPEYCEPEPVLLRPDAEREDLPDEAWLLFGAALLEALRPPELFVAVFTAERLEELPREEDFLAAPFLAAPFLAAPFLAAPFLADPFFAADFFVAPFFTPPFLAADFLAPPFLAADFLAPPFLAAPFLEAVLDERPLPEDEPPLEDEPPRRDLDAPFLDAPFEEDLPPERLLDDFLDAAFLVDFAIVNGFLVRVNKFLF